MNRICSQFVSGVVLLQLGWLFKITYGAAFCFRHARVEGVMNALHDRQVLALECNRFVSTLEELIQDVLVYDRYAVEWKPDMRDCTHRDQWIDIKCCGEVPAKSFRLGDELVAVLLDQLHANLCLFSSA